MLFILFLHYVIYFFFRNEKMQGITATVNSSLNLIRQDMCSIAQSCPTVCDPKDCCPPGSSVYRISQGRIMDRLPFCRFNPQVRKILWRRKWQPTPVFLPGKSHAQRSLVGCSSWGHKGVGCKLAAKQQQTAIPGSLPKTISDNCLKFHLPVVLWSVSGV